MGVVDIYEAWKSRANGTPIDVDKAYGNQCVDVDLSYGMALFPGVAWNVLFPPTGSAKNLGATHNDKYFEWIENNHSDVNQLPQKGDILVTGATPTNGDGHTGVVDSADRYGYTIVMQDGTNPRGLTFIQSSPWSRRPVLGWLRPRLAAAPSQPVPSPTTSGWNVGDTVWLHANTWRTYDPGAAPNGISNKILLPNHYNHGPGGRPGTQYTIKKVSSVYRNTVTITTDSWGDRDIYLDGDASKV